MKIRKLTLLLFLLSAVAAAAQEYTIKQVPTRIRLSYETVALSSEPDIGFVGIGYDWLSTKHNKVTWNLGLHAYSAFVGQRPGLITLGVGGGLRVPIWKAGGFFTEANIFVGGGGGGSAKLGGGLIVRPSISLEKRWSNFGLRVGYSRIDFVSGQIKGNQFNVGVTLNEHVYLKTAKALQQTRYKPELIFKKTRLAFTTTLYHQLQAGSTEKGYAEAGYVGLVGVELDRELTPHLSAMFKTNGALKGGTPGYMSILLGAGGRVLFFKDRVELQANALLGPSGGGGVLAGGGATAQLEAAVAVRVGNGFSLKLAAGKTFAPWGNFNAQHAAFSLGKSVDFFSPTDKAEAFFRVDGANLAENHMSFAVFNRLYISPKDVDRWGRPYNPYFNALGFEFQKYTSDRWALTASTIWAYQGGYGAYAEGLVGLAYYLPLHKHFSWAIKALIGAAGGGGLDVESGLITQFNSGVEWNTQAGDVLLHAGRYIPFAGSFDPWSIDVGFRVHIHQLYRK